MDSPSPEPMDRLMIEMHELIERPPDAEEELREAWVLGSLLTLALPGVHVDESATQEFFASLGWNAEEQAEALHWLCAGDEESAQEDHDSDERPDYLTE